jgi:hypothetical protein
LKLPVDPRETDRAGTSSKTSTHLPPNSIAAEPFCSLTGKRSLLRFGVPTDARLHPATAIKANRNRHAANREEATVVPPLRVDKPPNLGNSSDRPVSLARHSQPIAASSVRTAPPSTKKPRQELPSAGHCRAWQARQDAPSGVSGGRGGFRAGVAPDSKRKRRTQAHSGAIWERETGHRPGPQLSETGSLQLRLGCCRLPASPDQSSSPPDGNDRATPASGAGRRRSESPSRRCQIITASL